MLVQYIAYGANINNVLVWFVKQYLLRQHLIIHYAVQCIVGVVIELLVHKIIFLRAKMIMLNACHVHGDFLAQVGGKVFKEQ